MTDPAGYLDPDETGTPWAVGPVVVCVSPGSWRVLRFVVVRL